MTPAGRTVGVAMATWNGGAFLEEQLRSILAQDLPPDLVVVSDDGSTDRTAAIVAGLAARHPSVRWLPSDGRRRGYVGNFERALAACDTDITALADQDDVWLPAKLSRAAAALEDDPAAGLAWHDADLMLADGRAVGRRFSDAKPGHVPRDVAGGRRLVAGREGSPPGFSLAFTGELRRQALPFPFPAGVPAGWSHDWWIMAVGFVLFEPVFLPEPLARYRLHPSQASGPMALALAGTPHAPAKPLLSAARLGRNLRRAFLDVVTLGGRRRSLRVREELCERVKREAVLDLLRRRRALRSGVPDLPEFAAYGREAGP